MKRKVLAIIAAICFTCVPVYAEETTNTLQPSTAPIDQVQIGMSYEDVVLDNIE